ncbi:hypothetical protein DFR49_0764 [Hephaestia caeni]|uniref:DUF64370 domain-containing protein n=1 Tax=Hephaestia caeni TaxID=645617 RepID=A0A397PKN1_9SPHN|nr:DUF6437 family protein [Hephaestia caeni]RIA46231.1 hypothetical protein DFR49_0764 [Hephaestia caeni]
MAKKSLKPSEQLRALADEKAALDAREKEMLARIAGEFGGALVSSGLADLSKAEFGKLAQRVAALGVPEVMKRLA